MRCCPGMDVVVADQEQITERQLGAMLFGFLAGGMDAFWPRYVAADAGGASLASLGLATGLALVLAGIMLKVARRVGRSGIVGYAAGVLGSPSGQTAGALYVLLLVFGAAQPLAGVGLIGNVAFGWWAVAVPPLIFFLAGACAVLAGLGLPAVARISEYAAPVVLLLFLAVGLVGLGRVDWAHFKPVLAAGWGPVWRGVLHLLGRFCAVYILLLLVPFTVSGRRLVWLTPLVVGTAGLALAAGILPAGIYGAGAAAVSFIPFLQMLDDHVFSGAPRLMDPAVGLWLLGLVFQAVIAFVLLTTVLAQAAGTERRRFLIPAGAAVAWTGLLLWSNAGGAYAFGERYLRYFLFPAAIGVPLLLLLLPGLRMLWTGYKA
ncbi:MAG: GerAB/ArcD/ProY family transporter [Peptococcaceae bacterium]|nr:GerAB/ArcD/ProY family transporter [Peptococcaceae bacterium]